MTETNRERKREREGERDREREREGKKESNILTGHSSLEKVFTRM